MYKETCKTTKYFDFEMHKYSLQEVWQLSNILTLILFMSLWEIQMFAVPSHGTFPMGFP